MSQSNLAAAAALLSPSQYFTQSIQQVQAYAAGMANLSLTGDNNIDPVLTQCKNDAAQWYNNIYPAYLNMPATINQDAPLISNGLALLKQLNGQLNANPGSATIRQSINQGAASLQQTVQNIQQQVNGLANSLISLKPNIYTDYNALVLGVSKLTTELNTIQSDLNEQYGNLHSLENATCPNNDSINACKQLIGTLSKNYGTVANTLSTVNNLISIVQSALNGLNYLSAFWQSAGTDATNCLASLIKLQRDPDNLLLMDIQVNQNQWNLFEQLMAQITPSANLLLNK